MITSEKLINAGFKMSIVNEENVYTRDGYSFVHNGVKWCPCNLDFGIVAISNVCLETMEELERFIIETKNM